MKIEPFLDRNVINEKSDNIIFEINEPVFEKVVLKLDRDYELTNGYFTIIYCNNEYLLYYKACPYPYYKDSLNKTYYETAELADYEYFCLAVSNDGLNFEKKDYNIIHHNILKHDLFCHNFYPFYDKKNNKFLGLSGTSIYNNGLHLFESNDGINWIHIKKILDENNILPGWNHNNHFDSHNCIVYNENDDYYYIYIRDNKPNQRFVQYTKTKDFSEFSNCININIHDNNNLVFYTPGIFKYENSNYFIGIPTSLGNSYDDKNNSTFMFSSDGLNFNILTRNLFDNDNDLLIDKSLIISKYNINSIVQSQDNSKMYIYTHYLLEKESFITCHSFNRNRINKIICKDYGYIKTNLIKISNKITVNYETFNDGFFTIKLINNNNEIVYDTINYYGSRYELEIIWNHEKIIKLDNYYVKFDMYNCILYSFSYDN